MTRQKLSKYNYTLPNQPMTIGNRMVLCSSKENVCKKEKRKLRYSSCSVSKKQLLIYSSNTENMNSIFKAAAREVLKIMISKKKTVQTSKEKIECRIQYVE